LAEHDDLNELTAIKLALELLEHRTALSDYQHTLLDTALQATDRLNTRLLGRVAAARQRALLEQAEHLQDHGDRAADRQAAGAAHQWPLGRATSGFEKQPSTLGLVPYNAASREGPRRTTESLVHPASRLLADHFELLGSEEADADRGS
jgi:signal transduction histidine kinase